MGMDQQRSLLDQFFGPDRDIPSFRIAKPHKKFYDKDVCKFFIAGLCPYQELFKNTKSDLGPCQYNVHDAALKEEFNNLDDDQKRKFGYERELLCKLQYLVRDMDRKIARNKQRAEEENAAKSLSKEQNEMLDNLPAHI